MIQIYTHKFKSGRVYTLTGDLSLPVPSFKCEPLMGNTEDLLEYKQWVDDVVMPDVMEHISMQQLKAMAEEGKKIIESALGEKLPPLPDFPE